LANEKFCSIIRYLPKLLGNDLNYGNQAGLGFEV